MRTVYEAASAVEAHMLADLLRQEGLAPHIHGEHLQGAIGELPAAGLVRLVIADEEHAKAREIIQRWETAQPAQTPPRATTRSRPLWVFLVGLGLGIGGTYALLRVPAQMDGYDHDRDGVLDEKWTYASNGLILKLEVDRNLDKKLDYVGEYSRGLLESAMSDDDFDGVMETRSRFRGNNLVMNEVDTDADGYPDVRMIYSHGVMTSTEYLDPATGHPLRVEHFKLNVLTVADMDLDRDGRLDTRYTYSPLGEITARAPITK